MMRVIGRLADGWLPSLPRLPLDEVPASSSDRRGRRGRRPRPGAIRRIANVGGEITDGAGDAGCTARRSTGSRSSPALVVDFGFDGFVFAPPDGSLLQIERFATEVAPAVRSAVGA